MVQHRQSFDLDLYSQKEFVIEEIVQRLEKSVSNFSLTSRSWQTIIGYSEDTEISLFHYSYDLLEETTSYKSIKVASLEDIAAMKIEAIAGRGLKRDFFDIYSICKLDGWDLQKVINLNTQKYKRDLSDLPHILKSLTFFTDGELKPERAEIVDSEWNSTKQFFIDESKVLLRQYLG